MTKENKLKCPNCLSPVTVDADFCPYCKVKFYNCSKCDALVLETDTVCKNCNSDLEDAIEQSPEIFHSRQPMYKYKSLEILTNILVILLCAIIFFSVINIYADINDISYISNNYESGGILYYDDSSFEYFLISISQLLFIVVFFISFIIYLMWVRQAYRNLHSLQIKPTEYSSGWAIGAYFVPILNLVRPYSMMKEIWFGSQPIADGTSSYSSEKHFGL